MTDSDTDSDETGAFVARPNKRVVYWVTGFMALALVVSAGVVAVNPFGAPAADAGDVETVELVSDGEVVSTVTAETAVTRDERETGLSNHESLDAGEGMLFYHSESGEKTYVMPDMDFGIDIVFIGPDCTIQSIQSAERPADGESGYEPKHQYTADANYVLEVPLGYATERVSEGDSVRFSGGCEG
jgi:uncharacterized membrane protein (UPF0127 family)